LCNAALVVDLHHKNVIRTRHVQNCSQSRPSPEIERQSDVLQSIFERDPLVLRTQRYVGTARRRCRERHLEILEERFLGTHLADAQQSRDVVPVDLGQISRRQLYPGQLFPHRLGQVQAERRTGADRDSHQHPQKPEHVQVETRLGRWVQDETIPVGAGVVAPVRCRNQQRQGTVLEFVAHLGDALAVAAAAVVDALPCHTKKQSSCTKTKRRTYQRTRLSTLCAAAPASRM
jgi:hypothetical protein